MPGEEPVKRSMRHVATSILPAVAACGFLTMALQVSAQQVEPGKGVTLDIVEVVGCLTEGADSSWTLTNATDPVVADSPSTSADALEVAKAKPLGKQRYILLGVATNWDPASHKGHKMAVRGILIEDSNESRINVTSFQMAGTPNCGT